MRRSLTSIFLAGAVCFGLSPSLWADTAQASGTEASGTSGGASAKSAQGQDTAAATEPVGEKPSSEPTAAEEPASGEAAKTVPAPAAVACTVMSVTRTVRWRASAEASWQDMAVGDRLSQGADICTGLRSSCRLEFGDAASVVDVEPMTVVRIGEYETDGEKVRTRLYLKQGTVQADVEKARFQSDFAIVSPEVTLAVRGTRGIQFRHYHDTGAHCSLLESGRIQATQHRGGRSRHLRPGDHVATEDQFQPPIRTVQTRRLIPTYDQRSPTPQEVLSLLNRPQVVTGPPAGSAPGSGGNAGTMVRRRTVSQQGIQQFYRNHPDRLPGATPAPAKVDDHGGSGM
jgi:hypothetical protein